MPDVAEVEKIATKLPEAGIWTIDPTHSSVEFVVRHMMMSKVRGRFEKFSGQLEVGETLEKSHVEVSIDIASINTGQTQRDDHLRSPDFFEVTKNPTITYVSKSLSHVKDNMWKMIGDLTMHGVTKTVELKVEVGGVGMDPFGNERVGFTIEGELNREEFGLKWNQALETGGVLVSRNVQIEINAELTRVTK